MSPEDGELARYLLAQGSLSEATLRAALGEARGLDQSLARVLLQRGLLPAAALEAALGTLAGATPSAGSPPPQVPSQAPAGPGRFGPYRELRKLAEGGMGAVFEVEHSETGGRYALKTIKPEFADEFDQDALERLRREARLCANLDHPAIVRVHAAEFSGPTPYLVQDLLPGGSLEERVLQRGTLSPKDAVEVGLSLASGLAAAHAAGVLHRDLKPANVIFNDQGQAVIVDFGLSRRVGHNTIALTKTGEILGTPAYMAPEQAMNAADAGPAADVYALGALLFFALEGRAPFAGQTMLQILGAVLEQPAPKAESAPAPLAALLARTMAKSPSERPAASDLEHELRAVLAAKPAARPPVVILLAGASLLVLASLVWVLRPGARLGPAPPSPTLTPSASNAEHSLVPSSELTPRPSLRSISAARLGAASIEELASRLDGERLGAERALAAVDLWRLSPEHPRAEQAREIAQGLRRRPLFVLPSPPRKHGGAGVALQPLRSLAAVGRDRVVGVQMEFAGENGGTVRRSRLHWIQLGARAWVPSEVAEGHHPDGILSRKGTLWLGQRTRAGEVFRLLLADLERGPPTLAFRGTKLLGTTETKLRSVPALSPGGRWLAVCAPRGASDLYLFDLSGAAEPTRLSLKESHQDGLEPVVCHPEFADEETLFVAFNWRVPDGTLPRSGHVLRVSLSAAGWELAGSMEFGDKVEAMTLDLVGKRGFAAGPYGELERFPLVGFPAGRKVLRDGNPPLSDRPARPLSYLAYAQPTGVLWAVEEGPNNSPPWHLLRGGEQGLERVSDLRRNVNGISLSEDGQFLVVEFGDSDHPPDEPGEVWYVGELPE